MTIGQRLVARALAEVTRGPAARLRLAFLSDCAAYEHWLKFELAYAAGRRAYFGPRRSPFWTRAEKGLVDVSLHRSDGDGDHDVCNVELKVLTNNKNFVDSLGAANNSVARDFDKLREQPKTPGVVVIALSRKVYKPGTSWPSFRPYTMAWMRQEVRALAEEKRAVEFFAKPLVSRPVQRMKQHLAEHELDVFGFYL